MEKQYNNLVKNIKLNEIKERQETPVININIKNYFNLAKNAEIEKTIKLYEGFDDENFNGEYQYSFDPDGQTVIKSLILAKDLVTFNDQKIILQNNQIISGLNSAEKPTDAVNKKQLDDLIAEINNNIASLGEQVNKNSQNIETINQAFSNLNLAVQAESLIGELKKGYEYIVPLVETFNNYPDVLIRNNIIINESAKSHQQFILRISLENNGILKDFSLYLYKLPILSDNNYIYKATETIIGSANFDATVLINLEKNSSYQFKYFVDNNSGSLFATNGKFELLGNLSSTSEAAEIENFVKKASNYSLRSDENSIEKKLEQIMINKENILNNNLDIGDLKNLTTFSQEDLVSAINEFNIKVEILTEILRK